MAESRLLELLTALTRNMDGRRSAAAELARELGAEDLLVLIQGQDRSFYRPPLGFPQTLYGGRQWNVFTQTVRSEGRASADLPYPAAGEQRKASGYLASDSTILVLFGHAGNLPDGVQTLLTLLPLATVGFQNELTILTAAAEAKLSAQAAQQARELAESLDAVRRQLQATIMLREQDLAERKRIEGELERSNADLKRVNDDLSQFTFAATHDIREPLRMMSIYVELLRRECGDTLSETGREYIAQVINGAHRISRLIAGLLQFTRLGELTETSAQSVRAESAVTEALDDLQLSIAETHATVTVGSLPVVLADHLHLRQLFQNLVGNALKYRRSEVPPQVHISAKKDGDYWVFTVEDNGIGIAPQHREEVFIPFKRLHGSEISGVGIGLATCKRIIERHGGRIWIVPKTDGSIFQFSLPAGMNSN